MVYDDSRKIPTRILKFFLNKIFNSKTKLFFWNGYFQNTLVFKTRLFSKQAFTVQPRSDHESSDETGTKSKPQMCR